MSPSPERSPIIDPNKAKKKRHWSWSELASTDGVDNEALKQVILKLRHRSFSNTGTSTPYSEPEPESESVSPNPVSTGPDYSSLLSDQLLLNIFSRISNAKQHISNSLVCKRWCMLCGKLIQSIKLLDWEFLESGRLNFRFPNLVDINIVPSSVKCERNSGILLSNKCLEVYLNSEMLEYDGFFVSKDDILDSKRIDRGVRILAEGCRNLRRVALMHVSEEGLSFLGAECELLQEMELHNVDDLALKGMNKCQNLQILKLIGKLNGVYDSVVSDIGMTILAQGCRRLLKLELVGCEGSYEGIRAIGMCCQMLEELTLGYHKMEGGWLSALSYCQNLMTLRIQSCTYIDENPGQNEHLRSCPMLEELHLRRCRLRDKNGLRSLFLVCKSIKGLVIEDCWGLDSNTFAAATLLRNMKSVSLEGCSLLTTSALESVVLSWKDLDRLKVVSCKNVRDSEITPELATLFSVLKELKWRPDSKSLLNASLEGTGIGQKGGRSLKGK